MGARTVRLLILSLFIFVISVEAKERSRGSGVSRNVINFVWKNPTACKVDSLLQVLLLEDASTYKALSSFWKKSTLCSSTEESRKKPEYLVKEALIAELKRVLNVASKKDPSEFAEAIHNKRFQRYILSDLNALYLRYLKREFRSFSKQMNESSLLLNLEQNSYSNFKEGDIRRLVEFSVHRSASGHSFNGNKITSASYGSVVKLRDRVGLVNRMTWYSISQPEFEPNFMSDAIHGTYEVGFTTLGNEKIAAEIVGIFEVSNHGKPNKLLALNIHWTPLESEDLEISVTAWTDQNNEEKFVGVSGSYTFESHPFEPFVRLLKRVFKRTGK